MNVRGLLALFRLLAFPFETDRKISFWEAMFSSMQFFPLTILNMWRSCLGEIVIRTNCVRFDWAKMAANVDESVWKGPVLRQQRRDGTWQPLGLEVFKDEFKCYKNEVCLWTFSLSFINISFPRSIFCFLFGNFKMKTSVRS
jgi:hypothetical protein